LEVELTEDADLEGQRLIAAHRNGFFNLEKHSVVFQILWLFVQPLQSPLIYTSFLTDETATALLVQDLLCYLNCITESLVKDVKELVLC